MDLPLEGFITFIGQDQHFRMPGFSFFRNLVRTELTSVRQFSPSSFCLLSRGLSILSFSRTKRSTLF
nr:hypothetical protein Iba_chr10cCG4970 [Ipomoea batatas]